MKHFFHKKTFLIILYLDIIMFLPHVIILMIRIFWHFLKWLMGKKDSTIYGSAAFLSGKPLKSLLSSKNVGLIVDGKNGRLSAENAYKHLCLIAPTGAGKSSIYVVPNLLQLDKNSSCVVTDCSGELYEKTAGHLQKRGFKIKRISVSSPSESSRYNPLFRCSSITDIKKLSSILISSAFPQNPSASSAFWNDSAVLLISTMLQFLKKEPISHQNLHNLRYLLNQFGTDGAPLNAFIARHADPLMLTEWAAILSQTDTVLQSILSTCKTALSPYIDPNLSLLTCEETLYFESLRIEPTVLYIQVPETDIKHFSFLLNLFYSQLLTFLMQAPKNNHQPFLPVYLMMDEFANIGKIPDFSTIINTIRKRKVSISIILQDLFQLHSIYGPSDTNAIINGGCGNHLFLPGLGIETAERIERILGKQTLIVKESGFGNATANASNRDKEIARSLMTAEEIRTMPTGKALFIHGNQKPVYLDTSFYFEDRALSQWAATSPPRLVSKNQHHNLSFVSL